MKKPLPKFIKPSLWIIFGLPSLIVASFFGPAAETHHEDYINHAISVLSIFCGFIAALLFAWAQINTPRALKEIQDINSSHQKLNEVFEEYRSIGGREFHLKIQEISNSREKLEARNDNAQKYISAVQGYSYAGAFYMGVTAMLQLAPYT